MRLSTLASHPLVSALRTALAHHRDLVLQAPTGSGKSTLVPLALLQQTPAAHDRILLLEPRRLAARAVAARMAALLGEPLGATVGYRMRQDSCIGPRTRLEVVTEGVLTRLLQDDPALEEVAYVIFDEYHERSLQADLGLALALDAREQLAASFRLLIMSATIEVEPVVKLLGKAGWVSAGEPAFPVEIRYLGGGPPALVGRGAPAPYAFGQAFGERMREIAAATRRALAEMDGDVLVFLPGAAEIRALQTLLDGTLPPSVQIWPLHGQMSAQAQLAVLAAAVLPARRVVLATNVAETSLTLPGVRSVVDSGVARRACFDPSTGMSHMELQRISRAASDQRAGRAGRLGPGLCLRLWSETAQSRLVSRTPAEILQADLAPLALELARWGSREAGRLRWLDPPPAAAFAQARSLLRELDALDDTGRLTARGQQMARLAVHPRLAHLLLIAYEVGQLALGAQLAALLSERDLLGDVGLTQRAGASARDADLRSRLELLSEPASPHSAAAAAIERVRRTAAELARAVRAVHRPGASRAAVPPANAAPGAAETWPGALLALAYPDRIGQRRPGVEGRYLLSNGRGALFAAPSALARAPLIVALQLEDEAREARVELAVPVTLAALEQWLSGRIQIEEQFGWDLPAGALLSRRVRRLGALLLEERTAPADRADPRTAAAMLEVVRGRGSEALPWDAQTRNLRARLEFVRALGRSDLSAWPPSDDAALLATLADWLAPYLAGVTSDAGLQRLPLREALLARLTASQRQALERLAPTHLAVPSGSSIPIDYLGDNAPSIAVRLQEVFGLAQGPRIGADTVPVTLQLLSPAHRPVQVTRDLAGFWGGSYAQVRRDLRGRYPKHYWPEDPLQAAATRGARSRATPARAPSAAPPPARRRQRR